MAHRSKKKHLKHEHEPARTRAKSPVAKAEAAERGIAKKSTRVRRAHEPDGAARKRKPPSLVRSLARKARKAASNATARVTAKPREVLSRAKAEVAARVSRVKAMLETEEQ